MKQTIVLHVCMVGLIAAAVGCNLSSPLTPVPPSVSGSTSGDDTLKVTAPSPQSPANGQTLADLVTSGLALTASPSTPTYATSASLRYEFELMNAGGTVLQRSSLQASPTWATGNLEHDTFYQWRVRAAQDGVAGPWSALASFRTRDLPAAFRCGPPFNTTPLGIIQCHRDLFPGHVNDEDVPYMLARIARDFNRAGVAGGPFGILWKLTNNNCHGYSCDVICSGQGNSQNQWDILIDETFANWGGDIDGIRVDRCEIQPSDLRAIKLEQNVVGGVGF